MNTVKDGVHDHIALDPLAEALVDTPAFQRLRHIKQLSTVRLVYPSANHTRFEHSLGVYHLASQALDSLGVRDERARHVRAAAVLHDIGHGPYGHQTEDVIMRHTGEHHDEIHDLLSGTEAAAALRDHDCSPERVADLVAGDGELGQLVSGELDVDRMDYLVRDAHHTGVPYGTIDTGRLVRQLRVRDGELVLAEGNVQTAESMLLARSLMNGVVYRHHVSRIAGAMLERGAERIVDGGVPIEAFRRFADHDLLFALREHAPTLGRRIEERDLFKRALWVGQETVPAGVAEFPRESIREAEADVAERADVPEEQVLLDVPSLPSMREANARVVVGGVVQRLETASELVAALRAGERSRWRLGVYTPGEHVDDVASAARDVLGIAEKDA
ncbi:HD domain-containing protein [Halomarina oriensis]|uniref:HD domain-containing protein n=1 Tax=Halomarina oriensis TaxID=671145 RepID=A0A6B0GSV5_9EURY|nr:HD domain-containing protein [Halomarina oriensis]MWG35733.1 HD domain-containing protein [Halomarina oriensis]